MPAALDEVRRTAARLARAQAKTATARDQLHLAVHRAREEGASWADVGRTLGVTRQTAQQRFGRTRVITTTARSKR
jgi:DNA-binding IclR family transcriptional regulator